MFLLKAAEKVLSLIPYKTRLAIYHTPLLILGRMLFSKIMPSSAVVKITAGPLKGMQMCVNLKCQKYYWLGTYEPSVQETLNSVIEPGYICYDIGAHIGYFSLIMARVSGEDGKVFAFEPDPRNFSLLNNNIQLNNLMDNIAAAPIAISSSSGSAGFQKGLDSSTGKLASSSAGVGIEVKISSLDDLVYRQGYLTPDLVKIDVEGFEDEVLSGGGKVLAQAQPIILCEIHTLKAAQKVLESLQEKGYSIFHVEGGLKPINCSEFGGHWLAYPKERGTPVER